MFEPTYLYLNEYLIRNSKTKKGVRVLSAMEMLRDWFDYTRELIKGRQYLIILCSAFGWLAEFGVLWLIAGYYRLQFGIDEFAAYIQAIFSVEKGQVFRTYNYISMCILLILLLLFLFLRFLRRKAR